MQNQHPGILQEMSFLGDLIIQIIHNACRYSREIREYCSNESERALEENVVRKVRCLGIAKCDFSELRNDTSDARLYRVKEALEIGVKQSSSASTEYILF